MAMGNLSQAICAFISLLKCPQQILMLLTASWLVSRACLRFKRADATKAFLQHEDIYIEDRYAVVMLT